MSDKNDYEGSGLRLFGEVCLMIAIAYGAYLLTTLLV